MTGYESKKKAAQDKLVMTKDEQEIYERGFIDGMQHQMQSSVDKAVNAMTKPTYYIPSKDQRTWVGLTDEEIFTDLERVDPEAKRLPAGLKIFAHYLEARLKEKNND